MHYKTTQKLIRASKLYVVSDEHDNVISIKIQLGKKEYVDIGLKDPFPTTVTYMKLSGGGGHYSSSSPETIIFRQKDDVINLFQELRNTTGINSETVEKIIELIGKMTHVL